MSLANAELKPTVAFTGNLQYQEDGVEPAVRRLEPELPVRIGDARAAVQRAVGRREARSGAPRACNRPTHSANAAFENARLELASASTELDAAREIVATQQKAIELARESLGIAEVSYENGVITATELNDARLSLLETEWELMQAKYNQIVAAARTRYAAGL